MASPPSLREVKAYLTSLSIDYSDIIERSELIERFNAVSLEQRRREFDGDKAKANGAFRRQSYAYAVRLYTDAALSACRMPDADSARAALVVILSNRSAAYLHLDQAQRAFADASMCLELDPSYVKGVARFAAACRALGRLEDAIAAYERALAVATDEEHRMNIEGSIKFLREQREESRREPAHHSAGDHTSEYAVGGEEGAIGSDGAADDGTVSGCANLLDLDDDLLLEVCCQLDSHTALANAAKACRTLHRTVSARAADGCYVRLCQRRWQATAETVARRASARRAEAVQARELLGRQEPELLAPDWQMLMRERLRRDESWAVGRLCGWSTMGENVFRGPVYGVQMVDDALLTSAEDGSLRLWDLASGQQTHLCDGHSSGILGCWLDPKDASRAVSGGFDGVLRQWDLSGRSAAAAQPVKLSSVRCMTGHAGPIVTVDATNDLIASTSFDGSLRLWGWDGRPRATIDAHEGHASGLVLLSGGGAVTGGDDGMVKSWDLETQACVSCHQGHAAGEGGMGAVWSCAAYGGALVSGSTDGSIRLWDLREGDRSHLLAEKDASPDAHGDSPVPGLRLDGNKVVSSSFDGTVKIWELRTLSQRACVYQGRYQLTRLVFDDTRIVCGSLNGVVCVFDML